MLKLIILFVFITTTLTGYASADSIDQFPWWDTDDYNKYNQQSRKVIPFPQCLRSNSKSNYLQSSNVQNLYTKAIHDEEEYSNNEHYENYNKQNDDIMDYDAGESRYDTSASRVAAAAATKLTNIIMTKLACNLTGIDGNNLDNFLNKFAVPAEFCTFRDKPDCTGKLYYRTITGVCNNIDRPYDGSAQTAFGRLIHADYDDKMSKPRRKASRGGYLPGCRTVSLQLGSTPVFNRQYNNLFAGFAQFIAHDVSLSTPVTDSYLTPITSCTCESKHDWNKCTVIDVPANDPYMGSQKCMAFPASAQAFKDELCTLGVKEQQNGNTAFVDLSAIYGSSWKLALALRGANGTLKSTKIPGFEYEYPPGQREGKSCHDSTSSRKCFAAGDSRNMVTLLFTAIDVLFIRLHNILATAIYEANDALTSDQVYEVAKQYSIAVFQKIVYRDWLPILLGTDAYTQYLGNQDAKTTYDSTIVPVVYNECATGALRLHTLCRDLFSRCTPDGKRIDQLWLNDIVHQSKYAYDIKNNGLDSILCGALYDYGFAYDTNFAYQMHHGLFESTNKNGYAWRNDLIAINICRGREHGIPSYNAFREFCNRTKAIYFEDFGDTVNYKGIQLLKQIYVSPDDVDLFAGLNAEDPVPGGLVGPTSACLLGTQFKVLRDGDRFFFSHKNTDSTVAHLNYNKVKELTLQCFLCNLADINQIPPSPFMPPNDITNPLQDCDACDNKIAKLVS